MEKGSDKTMRIWGIFSKSHIEYRLLSPKKTMEDCWAQEDRIYESRPNLEFESPALDINLLHVGQNDKSKRGSVIQAHIELPKEPSLSK